MQYINFTCLTENFEILTALFFDANAEGIVEDDCSIEIDESKKELSAKAFYYEEKNLELDLKDLLNSPLILNYKIIIEKDQDWEKNFRDNLVPIEISDKIKIFQTHNSSDIPSTDTTKINLIIDPQMTFGTGTHETTKMCLNFMESLNLDNASFLDAGTGTGILSIAAEKLGAKNIKCFDIEKSCIENTVDNFIRNNVNLCELYIGSVEALLENQKYDFIVSNIIKQHNLPIIPKLSKLLKENGFLIYSGFLNTEKEEVLDCLEENNLNIVKEISLGEWYGGIAKL